MTVFQSIFQTNIGLLYELQHILAHFGLIPKRDTRVIINFYTS